MKKLFLKSLTITSDIEESANQFIFQKKNLILSDDNGVGKSTLIDMIFWTLGCRVDLKPDWLAADVKSLLEIQLDDQIHTFAKIKSEYFYKVNNDDNFQRFNKVTGEFTNIVLSIFGMSYLKLFSKNNDLIVPTPDYLLSLFYIDQAQWNSDFFSNIKNKYISKSNYDNILKLFIGHIDVGYFERILDINEKNKKIVNLENYSRDIDNSKSTITKIYNLTENDEKYLPLVMEKDFSKILKLIEEKASLLIPEKYSLSSEINNLQNDRLFYSSQLDIVKTTYEEYEKDYIDAVENQDMEITCPVCGVEHYNSIGARAQILMEKTESVELFNQLTSIINNIEKKIVLKKNNLLKVTQQLNQINESFSLNEEIESSQLTIDKLASLSVEKRLFDEQESIASNIKSSKKALNRDKKENKDILKKLDINEINLYFIERFSAIAQTLGVSELSYEGLTSPLAYSKLVFDKGADSARGVLSLYLALWQTMERNQTCFFPLFIDTPNQQEQDLNNYPKIVKAIIDNVADDSQIFVCALDNIALDELKNTSLIINLAKPILDEEKYETLKDLTNIL